MKIEVQTDDGATAIMTGAGAYCMLQFPDAQMQLLIAANGKDAARLVEQLALHANYMWPEPKR